MRGVVLFVSHGVAHVYTSESPVELLLDLRTSARKVNVGDWIECSAYKCLIEWYRRIEPALKTQVVDGKVQIETKVRVLYDEIAFDSQDFGRVAYLGQKPPSLKMGHIYKCVVSRDPEHYSNVYANLSVKWHILPNTLVEDQTPSTIWSPPAADQTIQPVVNDGSKPTVEELAKAANFSSTSVHNGVVVGKRGRNYIIYCRIGFVTMIDKWKRETEPLDIGSWVMFKSKKLAPKKSVVDSNSWRQIPPQFITKVEDDEVVLTVPCHVKRGKIFTDFLPDITGTEYEHRLRECRAVAKADDKGRFRWKLTEKQSILPPRVDRDDDKVKSKPKEQDFSKDVDIKWNEQQNDSGIKA